MSPLDKKQIFAAFGWLPSVTKMMADRDWMAARDRLRAAEPAPGDVIAALRYARDRLTVANTHRLNQLSRVVDLAKAAALRLQHSGVAPPDFTRTGTSRYIDADVHPLIRIDVS